MGLQPIIGGITKTGEDKANGAELIIKYISKELSKVIKKGD